MKVVTVYFREIPQPGREHHDVDAAMLDAWVYFYAQSGTTAPACLLTDAHTQVPASWPYEVMRLHDTSPPYRRDVLNKVGWIKAQAFARLGHCLIMDLDALPLQNLDRLAEVQAEIAMAPDAGHTWEDAGKHGWAVDEGFGAVGPKHNAGVMILRSPRIWPLFRAAWDRYWSDYKATFLDELIFSSLRCKLQGATLPQDYNVEAEETPAGWRQQLDARVLHFRSGRKQHLAEFHAWARRHEEHGLRMVKP